MKEKKFLKTYNREYLDSVSTVIFDYRDKFSNMVDLDNNTPGEIANITFKILEKRFKKDVNLAYKNAKANIKIFKYNALQVEKVNKQIEREEKKQLRKNAKKNKRNLFKEFLEKIFKRHKNKKETDSKEETVKE